MAKYDKDDFKCPSCGEPMKEDLPSCPKCFANLKENASKKKDVDDTVKAQVTTKAIETDHLRYFKVAPDQVCDESIIPTKEPTRQMDWTVSIGKGAVYNPKIATGIYANVIEIGYGARINGSVYGRSKITIDTGASRIGQTFIYGDVSSPGDIIISAPNKKMRDYKEGSVVVTGNIIGKTIEITSAASIKGNVMAEKDIAISARCTVHGFIYSKNGTVSLEGVSAYGIIAGNKQKPQTEGYGEREAEPPATGVSIGRGVSLLVPLIWVKNNMRGIPSITFKEAIRVIDSECADCTINEGREGAMRCAEHLQGTCDKYMVLDDNDIMEYLNGTIASNAWRTCREPESDLEMIAKSIDNTLRQMKNEKEILKTFMADEYGHFMTVGDMASKVEQKISQTIYKGDYIAQNVVGDVVSGTKVDIKDGSAIISNYNERGAKDDTSKPLDTKVNLQDSMAMVTDDYDKDEEEERVEPTAPSRDSRQKTVAEEEVNLPDQEEEEQEDEKEPRSSFLTHALKPKKRDNSRIPKRILQEIGMEESNINEDNISDYVKSITKKTADMHNNGFDVSAIKFRLKRARILMDAGDIDSACSLLKECDLELKRLG